MRKIAKRFEQIWAKAEKRNAEIDPSSVYPDYPHRRFQKIWQVQIPKQQNQQNKRYVTMGIYDSFTKKYATFDTINLVGNFRYSPQHIPAELHEMDRIVSR